MTLLRLDPYEKCSRFSPDQLLTIDDPVSAPQVTQRDLPQSNQVLDIRRSCPSLLLGSWYGRMIDQKGTKGFHPDYFSNSQYTSRGTNKPLLP